jgi:uncharacterized protein (TIGR00661 family)
MRKSLKIAFNIQCEGYGHITQAEVLKKELEDRGHEVCHVSINKEEKLDELKKRFKTHVTYFKTPTFSKIFGNISNSLTLINNSIKSKTYKREVLRYKKEILNLYQPDIIINFYDWLPIIAKNNDIDLKCKVISIAHQFSYLHNKFLGLSTKIRRFVLNRINSLYQNSSDMMFSLNLDMLDYEHISKTKIKNLYKAPPLIDLSNSFDKKEISYTIKELIHEIIKYNKDTRYLVSYFTDEKDEKRFIKFARKERLSTRVILFAKNHYPFQDDLKYNNLYVYTRNRNDFIYALYNSCGYIGNCGFETIAESVFLDKKVIYVKPASNHLEQKLNSKLYSSLQTSNFYIKPYSNIKNISHLLDTLYISEYRNIRDLLHVRHDKKFPDLKTKSASLISQTIEKNINRI